LKPLNHAVIRTQRLLDRRIRPALVISTAQHWNLQRTRHVSLVKRVRPYTYTVAKPRHDQLNPLDGNDTSSFACIPISLKSALVVPLTLYCTPYPSNLLRGIHGILSSSACEIVFAVSAANVPLFRFPVFTSTATS